MQLENENTKCLGLVEGYVKKFKVSDANLKVPHMGWNKIKQKSEHEIWNKISDNSYFYFVHSYFVVPKDKNVEIFKHKTKKILGLMWHPERNKTYNQLNLIIKKLKIK